MSCSVLQSVLVYGIDLAVGELAFRLLCILPAELQRRRASDTINIGQLLADVLLPVQHRTGVALLLLLCGFCSYIFNSSAFSGCLVSIDSAYLVGVYCLWRWLGLTASRMDALQFIRAARGLDYGSGMALSYFYGYLRLVLPAFGDHHSKSIRDRIEDFECSQSVHFPIKKLFVLVPDSMYTPQTLAADTLTVSKPLESVVVNRAGSVRRVYHNSVYKVEGTGGWYVAVEGATPLNTFSEALRSADGGTELDRYRADIVESFVRHLLRLLRNDEACRDLAVVVTFRDRDADGNRVDYGKVVRREIEKLMR